MSTIPILPAATDGHQFVIYGDSCSGVPGALHETKLAQINAVLQRLAEDPQFVCFPGDEIIGLTPDEANLRQQWSHWFNHEMAWLDRETIPLYHTTGNHTTYNPMSEAVFRDVMQHLPANGPVDQRGLSYYVRRDDLLMIFTNTLWSGLGGEGNVETDWLDATLSEHADAKYKLVFGHHPVFTVNGFFADYQRNIEQKNGRHFWQILVKHGVLAYVCSHILAFDVQLHEGILQICTAGAGTAHRMPEGIEYLHALQFALDENSLRYQVLDTEGAVREWLTWGDWQLPPTTQWPVFDEVATRQLPPDALKQVETSHLIVWEISGEMPAADDNFSPQTWLSGWHDPALLPHLWLGISGQSNSLMFILNPRPNNSPHRWIGPVLQVGEKFSIQVAIHSGMSAGGMLWRWNDDTPWSSFTGASPWGMERLIWPHHWSIGQTQNVEVFRGDNLHICWYHRTFTLSDYTGT